MNLNELADDIVAGVRQATRDESSLNLHEPDLDESDIASVTQCLKSGWVSSMGPFVTDFERELARFTGAPFVVVVGTGTAALHAALHIMGIGAGDEVLVPALTFVATANAVTYTGATPHFVDVEEASLGMDPLALREHLLVVAKMTDRGLINKETGRRIAACVPMHCFGHPVKLREISELCLEFKISLIEDAAEALGSSYMNQHVGYLGEAGILSFNGNKIVTTGGGGAMLFKSEALARQAKHITTTAKKNHAFEFDHDQIGFNYRLPNLNAALGLSQLKKLPTLLEHKKKLASAYEAVFGAHQRIEFFRAQENTQPNHWLNALLISDLSLEQRNELLSMLQARKIFARPVWNLLSELEIYKHCPRSQLTVAKSLELKIINIPSSAKLGHHL